MEVIVVRCFKGCYQVRYVCCSNLDSDYIENFPSVGAAVFCLDMTKYVSGDSTNVHNVI